MMKPDVHLYVQHCNFSIKEHVQVYVWAVKYKWLDLDYIIFILLLLFFRDLMYVMQLFLLCLLTKKQTKKNIFPVFPVSDTFLKGGHKEGFNRKFTLNKKNASSLVLMHIIYDTSSKHMFSS